MAARLLALVVALACVSAGPSREPVVVRSLPGVVWTPDGTTLERMLDGTRVITTPAKEADPLDSGRFAHVY